MKILKLSFLMALLLPLLSRTQSKEVIQPLNFHFHNNSETQSTTLPEPMFFDLVRPLGAKKGELEVNTLLSVPIRRQGRHISWAPEIEFTILDGLGLEFEFPMQNNQLEAYKFALQGTIGQSKENKFIHGWQWISEYLIEDKSKDFTLIYLAGYTFDKGFSLFVMSGPRYVHHFKIIEGAQQNPEWHKLFNANFSKKISPTTTVCLEQNYARHHNIGHEYRVIPQVHQKLTKHLNLQMGIGYEWYINTGSPTFATRIIAEL